MVDWISAGFRSSGFRFGDDFSPTVFGSEPRNLSGSVLDLVFDGGINRGSLTGPTYIKDTSRAR